MTKSAKLSPNTFWLYVIAAIIAIVALLLIGSNTWSGSQFQILNRYATQMNAGNGFVFNSGERILLLPSPAAVILSAVIPFWTLVVLSLVVGGVNLYDLTRRVGLSERLGMLVAAFFVLASYVVLNTNLLLTIAANLGLYAVVLAVGERWRLSALVFALTILISPEMLVLACMVALLAAQKGAASRYLVTLFVPLIIAILGLYAYYGSALWAGLITYKGIVDGDWTIVLILLIPGVFGIYGWLRRRDEMILALLGAYTVIYMVMMLALFPGTIFSHLTPILGPVILLGMAGSRELATLLTRQWMPLIGYTLMGVVFIGVSGLKFSTTTLSAGALPPLSTTTDNGTIKSVAIPSVKFLPRLAPQTASTTIISFDGQLQPDLKMMLERGDGGDGHSALIRYAPERVFLVGGYPFSLTNNLPYDPALRRLYQIGEGGGSFPYLELKQPVGEFTDQAVKATFGPDITLVGAAVDQTALKANQVVRVRLDWQITRAATKNVTVALRLVGPDGEPTAITDEFDSDIFRVGKYSTFHTIQADVVPSQPVQLQVSLIINNGHLPWQTIYTYAAKP